MQVRRIVWTRERRSRIERLGCWRELDDEDGKENRGRDCQRSRARECAGRGSGHDVAHLLTAVVRCAHARACVVCLRAARHRGGRGAQIGERVCGHRSGDKQRQNAKPPARTSLHQMILRLSRRARKATSSGRCSPSLQGVVSVTPQTRPA
jgi:hypothetical protein